VALSAGAVLERAWAIAGREDQPIMTAFVAEQLGTAHWFDQRATRAALDWRPAVSLEEGFDRLAWSLT
jgi:nucleoside-diphosphate-sugar epimerase